MTRKATLCAYCGKAAPTRDHVPSRKFFPRPRPDNLITVPCCRECNGSLAGDEEYFLLRVLASASVGTPEALAVMQERFSTLDTPRRLRTAKGLAAEMERRPVYSPAGIYLGDAPAYTVDLGRCLRVIEKTVRGLYYHEFRRPVPAGMGVAAYLEPNRAVLKDRAIQWVLKTEVRQRGRTVFKYKVGRPADKDETALFLLEFYEGMFALGVVVDEADIARLHRFA